ncbi:hypothetical protein LINGRAHAP2_LOCUS30148 [Linum grandiflorum]
MPPLSLSNLAESSGCCEEDAHVLNEAFSHRIAPSDKLIKLHSGFSHYSDGSSKAAHIVRPLYRFLHLVFRQSITHRVSLGSVCNSKDIFLLRQIEEEKPVHLGPLVATLLAHQRTHDTAQLLSGSYITQLAKTYKCLDVNGSLDLYPWIQQDSLDRAQLQPYGITNILAATYPRYYGRHLGVAPPAPPSTTDVTVSDPRLTPTPDLSSVMSILREFQATWDDRWETLQGTLTNFGDRLTHLQQLLHLPFLLLFLLVIFHQRHNLRTLFA